MILISLIDELKIIRRNSNQNITHIKVFISEINDFINQIENRMPLSELTAKEKKELKAVIAFINKNLPQSPTREVSPPITSERVSQALYHPIMAKGYRKFLAEMAFIYLITSQEAFIKDYLTAILISKKSILRSKRQITFEEVCNFRSIKSLLRYMAEDEVNNLSYGDIDEIAKYFKDKYNISCDQDFEKWQIIREAYYRRNLIVHNRGITNKTYCKKTGYKKEGNHLQTELSYVIEVADAIIDFINFIHSSDLLHKPLLI